MMLDTLSHTSLPIARGPTLGREGDLVVQINRAFVLALWWTELASK